MDARTLRYDVGLVVMVSLVAAMAFGSRRASAQTGPARTPDEIQASLEAHRGDFDYLLGDWEFTGVRRMPAGELKFRGYWSATRLAEGQILDEYRVLGPNGETFHVTTTLRNYNAFAERWELVGANPSVGLLDFGTAHKQGAEMLIEQSFGVAGGQPSLWRIRYFDIQPERFSWTADRSTDGGATWATSFQRIEARRIGPPRSLEPLTSARK